MTDWELRYQTDDTPWEKGAPHPALLEFLRREPMHGRVLVPGCGTGHDVRTIAATADEVVGLDVAPSAIRRAKMHPTVGGEHFEKGDFFNLPAKHIGTFDWVFEHTCFCAIAPSRRADYVESAASAIRSGGSLFGIFYLNPMMEPGEEGPPFGTSIEELDLFFGGKFRVVREWLPEVTYPGREGRKCCRLLSRE